MQSRDLTNELAVSIVAFGGGPLGDERMDDAEARALVAAGLDAGITLFDTARSYGISEERLARHLGPRRRDVVLATKGGYGVDGVPDWTSEAVRLGIDNALRRLATDTVDVFLLHSCGVETLRRTDLLDELDRAKAAGKIRARGYSGDGEPLAWAVASGRFDVVECSVNPFDQAALASSVPSASALRIGVLAKRSLGNAAWRFDTAPASSDVRAYWERARAMRVDPSPFAWAEAALRFAAFAPGVTSALVGTSSPAHLREAVRAAAAGPLPEDVAERFRVAFAAHGAAWPGVI